MRNEELTASPSPSSHPKKQDEPFVLFQDDQLIVAYKPYGVLSESDEKQPNMPALLREQAGCREIYTVHRLDRTTQGLMVYAKTQEAARRLSEAVQNGTVEKIYLAVADGVPDPRAGDYADLLYFDRRKNKSYVVERERRGVKRASLSYEVIGTAIHEGHTLSLLKIRLHTGRTHQIRVQFASRHMPLVGDRRYGSRIQSENILLCASQLRLTHPFTNEALAFCREPDGGLFALFK